MADKARIGIIGTGWWATTAHFPSVQAHPKAELVAAADVRPDILGKAGDKYGVANTYTDYKQMIDTENLDGVVVAVWHAEHHPVARACLESGLNVMLEKPMVLRAAHARELVQLAQRNKRELIIGYPWHFTAHTLRAREVVQSGELGRVLFVNSTFASAVLQFLRGDDKSYEAVFGYPVHGPGDVYADIEKSGGGQGHLQVTHSAALALFVTGLKPVSAKSFFRSSISDARQNTAIISEATVISKPLCLGIPLPTPPRPQVISLKDLSFISTTLFQVILLGSIFN